jgi:uncharacterized membrane protein YidH (DUF202 family)
MFEDYVAGALLLIAGWAAFSGRRWGILLVLVAWAYVSALMSGSLWYQLEDTIRGNISEQNNSVVVAVKFLLWSIAVVSLILAFRNALLAMQRFDQKN